MASQAREAYTLLAESLGIIAATAQLLSTNKLASSGPTKELKQTQKKLESISILLAREKYVLGDEIEGFDKRYINIQLKIQREEKRIKKLSSNDDKKRASERIERLNNTIEEIKTDILSSSANARRLKLSSTSTLGTEPDAPNETQAHGSVSRLFSRGTRLFRSTTASSEVDVESTAPSCPTGSPGGSVGRSNPSVAQSETSESNEGRELYFRLPQPDGSTRLLHRNDILRDPSLVPQALMLTLQELVEAYQRTGQVAPLGGTGSEQDPYIGTVSAGLRTRSGFSWAEACIVEVPTAAHPIPVDECGLHSIPETCRDTTESSPL